MDSGLDGMKLVDGCVASSIPDKNDNPEVANNPESIYYNLSKKRLCYIFNHYTYDKDAPWETLQEPDQDKTDKQVPSNRDGTNADRDRLEACLTRLRFDVTIYEDLTYMEIRKVCSTVQRADHSQTSCIVFTIMTHGHENGQLCAYDKMYDFNDLLQFFTANTAEGLIFIPKLFFIQACRGNSIDEGTFVADGLVPFRNKGLRVSNHADMLIMYSTYPGFVAWRGWFIQALCAELDDKHHEWDLMSILTFVVGNVSHFYQSGRYELQGNPAVAPIIKDNCKQTPQIVSTLRKLLRF